MTLGPWHGNGAPTRLIVVCLPPVAQPQLASTNLVTNAPLLGTKRGVPRCHNTATSRRSANTAYDGSRREGDSFMRDIRSDLEERAHVIHEQLRAADAWFEKVMQKLQNERDAKVSDLKGTLAMIDKLMQFEARAMDKVVTLENPPAPQRSIIDRIAAVNAS